MGDEAKDLLSLLLIAHSKHCSKNLRGEAGLGTGPDNLHEVWREAMLHRWHQHGKP